MKQGKEKEMGYIYACDCRKQSYHILHKHIGLTGISYRGLIQCPYCNCELYIKIKKGKTKYDKNN